MAVRIGQSGVPAVSLLVSVLFVSLMVAAAYLDRRQALAIYSLSFWHYYLYGLAYFFGAVPLDVFKRDAIAMKTVSLVALASVYLAAPLDILSLAVVASGFLLNIFAARALGSDRTYYGHEVADLPQQQIRAFPYSWISHPMLVGNIAAFGGTMINADFRQQWWPLACAHVTLNLGLLIMELAVKPQRRGAPADAASSTRRYSIQSACCVTAAGAVLGAAAGPSGLWNIGPLVGAGVGASIFGYAYALYGSYSTPPSPIRRRREIRAEALHE